MIDNIFLIKNRRQVKALGNDIKLSIIRNLIEQEMTCQQLSVVLDMSKQKVHYNLRGLVEQDLINQIDNPYNQKEKHYRAKARNYVIDFSLGNEIESFAENGARAMIKNIVEHKYGLDLPSIASAIVKDSIRLQPGERLLIVTGKFNLPLVEMIQIAAGSIGAEVDILYRDQNYLRKRNEEFTLEAYRKDYEYLKKKLSNCDVYLYLNGESRYLELKDESKAALHKQLQIENMEIIIQNKVRVVMMPGLLNDSLEESNIRQEVDFWQSLDVDYSRLREETDAMIEKFSCKKQIFIEAKRQRFSLKIASIFGEYGSFGESKYQSNTINLPGGEVLLIPEENSINGTITGDVAYIHGKTVKRPVVVIKDNRIVEYQSGSNTKLLGEAIHEGGEDGSKIALICFGTNYKISSDQKDMQALNKSKGLMTVYWGNNTMMGGNVQGKLEWQLQIKNPKIIEGAQK